MFFVFLRYRLLYPVWIFDYGPEACDDPQFSCLFLTSRRIITNSPWLVQHLTPILIVDTALLLSFDCLYFLNTLDILTVGNSSLPTPKAVHIPPWKKNNENGCLYTIFFFFFFRGFSERKQFITLGQSRPSTSTTFSSVHFLFNTREKNFQEEKNYSGRFLSFNKRESPPPTSKQEKKYPGARPGVVDGYSYTRLYFTGNRKRWYPYTHIWFFTTPTILL